ncbi:hypothetical protein FHR34_007234 [Kitasatospora kifunensis]|uniref:Uncharacterized protein n=1 Tax=Kitasatospora kifunensis TaxID=58351 RepID=A0A7W7VZV9_KITKI|nr:hypothetical protein [Kitasatospora kifunensis]
MIGPLLVVLVTAAGVRDPLVGTRCLDQAGGEHHLRA